MARTPKMTEDRREQIIDAALQVFAKIGFARATNSEIAREAGNMTPGLIYYYFKSKEDLRKRGSPGAFTEAFLFASPSRDALVAARCAFASGCRASAGSDGK
jgi:AcrR family transcriptional regulator